MTKTAADCIFLETKSEQLRDAQVCGTGKFADPKYKEEFFELALNVKKYLEEYKDYSIPYKLYCVAVDKLTDLFYGYCVYYINNEAYWERTRIRHLATFMYNTEVPSMFDISRRTLPEMKT